MRTSQKRNFIDGRNMNLDEIVVDYLRRFASNLSDQLRSFREDQSLASAIRRAALAQGSAGKRLSHQRRIPRDTLKQSERILLSAEKQIIECSTFDELHELVSKLIGSIHGIAQLTVYDTALRIGAKLRLEPEVVYLHAGTMKGAKALGFDPRRSFIYLSEFPAPFQRLRPSQIEDLLCIYKDLFNNSKDKRPPVRIC